jgi:hypothetical protein
MAEFLMKKRHLISESKRTSWLLRIAVFVFTLSFANWTSLTTGRSAIVNDQDVMLTNNNGNGNLRKLVETSNEFKMSNRGLINTIKIDLRPGLV